MASITMELVEGRCLQKAFEIAQSALCSQRGNKSRLAAPSDDHTFRGLEDLIQSTNKACCSERSGRGFVLKLGRVLQSINDFAPTLDVIVQQQPIAAFIWGSIRFIVQAVAQASRAVADIDKGLSQIIFNIRRYHEELRLYYTFPRVVDATSAVFAQVIAYLTLAKEFLGKPPWERVARACFSSQLARILGELSEWNDTLSQEIRAASGQGQSDLRQDQKALIEPLKLEITQQVAFRTDQRASTSRTHEGLRHIKQQMDVISRRSICEAAQRKAQKDARDVRTTSLWLQQGRTKTATSLPRSPRTCEWIRVDNTYVRWQESNYKNCLHIQGRAGCGKSSLAKDLEENSSTNAVLSHFFRSSERRNLPPKTRLAVALLTEVFKNEDLKRDTGFRSIVQRLLPLTKRFSSALECPSDHLLDALDRILDLALTYTVIVDALDECVDAESYDSKEFSELLWYLRTVGSRPNVRVILLSRIGLLPEPALVDTTQLFIDERITQLDIVHFVQHEIKTNQRRNPDLLRLKDEVIAKIPTKCQGLFLLAKFMMENIITATNPNDMRARLDEFPPQLTDLYRKRLRETGRTLRENEKATRRLIFLLLLSPYGPFNVQAVSTILALNTETNSIDEDERLSSPIAEILKLCGPLVIVVKDQVQIVHESAREFLLKYVVTQEDSDAYLAHKCLSRLSEHQYRAPNFPARLLRRNLLHGDAVEVYEEPGFDESDFYKYACLHVQDHVTALLNPSDELLTKLSRFLVGNEFVTWSETLFQLKPKAGISNQVQIKAIFQDWYDRFPAETQEKIPIKDFLVRAHENLSNTFRSDDEDKILQYLPLVRLGQFFNVGGKNGDDYWKAYEYKMRVADGYEATLGPRNPLTLRAKTEVLKEFFFQQRFDEAEKGLKKVAALQHEVSGEDTSDYFITVQLLGAAHFSVAKFQRAICSLAAAVDGFRRIFGETDFYTLQSGMYMGHALEREAKFDEASRAYANILQLWVPIGGDKHPFSLMLKTGFGSACRQLGCFSDSETALLESLTGRKRLFTIQNILYIDSVLQVAALYYAWGRREEGIRFLDLISASETLQPEFERKCQLVHIRALIDLSLSLYDEAREALRNLLHEATGHEQERNNRELLWVRITLSDVLRQCGEDDEASMLFSDLVSSRATKSFAKGDEVAVGHESPSSLLNELLDEPESPAQLAIAERALRLVKAAKPEDADTLLRDEGLGWKRKKDFWVLQGGPITDTASISGLKSPEYYLVDPANDSGDEAVSLTCAGDYSS